MGSECPMCGYLERMKEAIKFLGTDVRVGGKLPSEGAEEGFGSSGTAQALERVTSPFSVCMLCKSKRITASEEKPECSLCMLP